MLSLLSITDAAYVVYCMAIQKDWQLAFNPMIKQEIITDEKKRNQLCMYEKFIENAIKAVELPALQKPKGRTEDKKLFERVEKSSNIPAEMPLDDLLDVLPQYDYWITQEDFWVFIERPSVISKDYAHGRDALAVMSAPI